MKQSIKLLICIILITFLFKDKVIAQELFEQNNKVGIHISDLSPDQIKPADRLVNSNAIDSYGNQTRQAFGYVTVVLRKNDLDHKKWQDGINQLREKFIPVYRIGSSFNQNTGCWDRLTKEDARIFANFIASLNNSVRPVFIVVGNEPNHAAEWGCQVDPKDYTSVYQQFIIEFSNIGGNYYLMPAGLDFYAPHQPPKYYDAALFLKEMYDYDANIFKNSALLSAHCYPDNDFSGPIGQGRYSLLCYQWLNQYLKSIGAIDSEKPICITETGYKQVKISEDEIAENIKIAYQNYWQKDPLVRCVTPFILNYCDPPFDSFSWKKCDGLGYKKVYQAVHDLSKTAGKPPQDEKVTFEAELKVTLVEDSRYEFPVKFTNDPKGQRIYDKSYGDSIGLVNPNFTYWLTPLNNIAPGITADLKFVFYSGKILGSHKINIGLYRQLSKTENKLIFDLGEWNINVIPPQALTIHIFKFPGFKASDCGYKISAKDKYKRTVYVENEACALDGIIYLDQVKGIIMGHDYTVIISKEGFNNISGQITITQSANDIRIGGIMLPFDRNGDGKISLDDLFS